MTMLLSHKANNNNQKQQQNPNHFTPARFTCTSFNFNSNDCVLNVNLPLLHRKAYSYTVPSFKNNTTQNAKIYHHKVDNWCEYLSGVAVLKLSVKGRVGYFQHWVTSGNDCLQLNLFTIFEYENLAKLTMGKYFSFDIC